MKYFTAFCLAVSFLFATSVSAQQCVDLPVREGIIKVYYGEKMVYLVGYDPKADADPAWWDGSSFYVEFMGVQADKNKLVTIDNVTHKVLFASSNTNVLEFERENVNGLSGVFNVWKSGKATVTISVANQSVQVPLEVIKLPIRIGMVSNELIKALGTPSHRTKSSDFEAYHQIGKKVFSVAGENWTYDKYPGLLLIVDPISGLAVWRMTAWDKVDNKPGKPGN